MIKQICGCRHIKEGGDQPAEEQNKNSDEEICRTAVTQKAVDPVEKEGQNQNVQNVGKSEIRKDVFYKVRKIPKKQRNIHILSSRIVMMSR
jgi:hypothetical protein